MLPTAFFANASAIDGAFPTKSDPGRGPCMTIDGHRKLAEKYIVPDRMIYLVVGDAKTQLERLGQLGMGDPTLLDREGNRVSGR